MMLEEKKKGESEIISRPNKEKEFERLSSGWHNRKLKTSTSKKTCLTKDNADLVGNQTSGRQPR